MPNNEYLSERVEELMAEVTQLKYRVRLLAGLVDLEREPFTVLNLSHELTERQASSILDLMDETRQAIEKGEDINHHKFEQKVYDIVPTENGNYHFAENIVSALNEESRYDDVYEYMKKDGMNI